jgi:hypothetical protein
VVWIWQCGHLYLCFTFVLIGSFQPLCMNGFDLEIIGYNQQIYELLSKNECLQICSCKKRWWHDKFGENRCSQTNKPTQPKVLGFCWINCGSVWWGSWFTSNKFLCFHSDVSRLENHGLDPNVEIVPKWVIYLPSGFLMPFSGSPAIVLLFPYEMPLCQYFFSSVWMDVYSLTWSLTAS